MDYSIQDSFDELKEKNKSSERIYSYSRPQKEVGYKRKAELLPGSCQRIEEVMEYAHDSEKSIFGSVGIVHKNLERDWVNYRLEEQVRLSRIALKKSGKIIKSPEETFAKNHQLELV